MAVVAVDAHPAEADVDGLAASVDVADKVKVDVAHLTLTTRGMPSGADARGALEGHLVVPAPSGGPVAVRAEWNGSVAAIEAREFVTVRSTTKVNFCAPGEA